MGFEPKKAGPEHAPDSCWPSVQALALRQVAHTVSLVLVNEMLAYCVASHVRPALQAVCPAWSWNWSCRGLHDTQKGDEAGSSGPEQVPDKAVPGPQALGAVHVAQPVSLVRVNGAV